MQFGFYLDTIMNITFMLLYIFFCLETSMETTYLDSGCMKSKLLDWLSSEQCRKLPIDTVNLLLLKYLQ